MFLDLIVDSHNHGRRGRRLSVWQGSEDLRKSKGGCLIIRQSKGLSDSIGTHEVGRAWSRRARLAIRLNPSGTNDLSCSHTALRKGQVDHNK